MQIGTGVKAEEEALLTQKYQSMMENKMNAKHKKSPLPIAVAAQNNLS